MKYIQDIITFVQYCNREFTGINELHLYFDANTSINRVNDFTYDN
jgi:hypothetical protein